MSFTVTAAQAGSKSNGMELALLHITGQSGSPFGSGPGQVTSSTPSVSITPDITGSLIAGTLLTVSLTSALSGTTFYEQVGGGGLHFSPFSGTSATGGTPQTMGSSSGTGISAVALEIKSSPTVAATSLSGYVAAETVTSGSVSPSAGDLLVALVSSNGGGSTTTMGVTDTSGLGLTWTEQVRQNTAGDGYTGIWTTVIPSAPPVAAFAGAAAVPGMASGFIYSAYAGSVTAPAAPASGDPVINMSRDAIVVITGGTVTGIAVNGFSLGTPVTFAVPAGGSVVPTYTGTLTWQWILLSGNPGLS